MSAPKYHQQNFHANGPVCMHCKSYEKGVCAEDGASAAHHANAGYCPLNRFAAQRSKPDGWDDIKNEPADTFIEQKPFDFPAAWSAIHALCFEPELSAIRGKFHAIIGTLPCGDCKNGALKYESDNPIDISSALAVARYTWNFQNHVNAKLGKPQLPWPDAARERGWDKLESPELCC